MFNSFERKPEETTKSSSQDQPEEIFQSHKDISLFYQNVHGYSGGNHGSLVHIETNAFYHVADQTVYVISSGPNKNTVEKYPIPDEIEKSKESIHKYLKENRLVFFPSWG